MHFDDKTIDSLADLLAEAATVEIMPRFRTLEDDQIRQKTSAVDLVTEGDIAAEKYITRILKERYPEALIVGEEAYEEDRTLLDTLGTADLAFVIDPIDGTFNFAAGIPLFGVMLAVVVKGETVAGIIHDPVGKDWLIGAKGAGAHLRAPSGATRKVKAAAPGSIHEMTGSVSWQYVEEPLRSTLARNHAKCLSQFGYRCAAHEYHLLATGNAHFAIYNKLMPWDHLAGVLIHQQAGGYAARLDGSVYLPSHVGGGLLVAPDKSSWEEIRRELWAD